MQGGSSGTVTFSRCGDEHTASSERSLGKYNDDLQGNIETLVMHTKFKTETALN